MRAFGDKKLVVEGQGLGSDLENERALVTQDQSLVVIWIIWSGSTRQVGKRKGVISSDCYLHRKSPPMTEDITHCMPVDPAPSYISPSLHFLMSKDLE